MSADINAWIKAHDIKVLHSEGGTGLAREWDDFIWVNNRRHLIVIDRGGTRASAEEAVKKFSEMHGLPTPAL